MKLTTVALISVQLVLVAVLSTSNVEGGAVKWPGQYMDDAKNYLITLFRDRVISRSVLIGHFEESMEEIKKRYAAAEQDGTLNGMSDDEKQAFYMKIVIDETKKLRETVDAAAKNKDPAVPAPELSSEHKEILNNLEMEAASDEDEKELLANELDQIASDEAEMGFSMSPEAKAAMKVRTKAVLTELMSNEMRQLAMAILTSYFTGGPISGVVTTAVSASIKFKLIEYLMNTVMDVLSSVMGREIHITSAIPSTTTSATPISA